MHELKSTRTDYLSFIRAVVTACMPDERDVFEIEGAHLTERLYQGEDITRDRGSARTDLGAGPAELKAVLELIPLMVGSYKALASLRDLRKSNSIGTVPSRPDTARACLEKCLTEEKLPEGLVKEIVDRFGDEFSRLDKGSRR